MEVFLDKKRLHTGRRFDLDFAKGLCRSLVAIPVVSCDALERMKEHSPHRVDNLLVEWLMMMECYRQENGRIKAVYPVTFGKRRINEFTGEVTIGNLFQEAQFLSALPDVVPSATIECAMSMLESSGVPVINASEFSSRTVKSIVGDLLKFLCFQAWQYSSTGLVEVAMTEAVNILKKYADDFSCDISSATISHDKNAVNPPMPAAAATAATVAPASGGGVDESLENAWALLRNEKFIVESGQEGLATLINDVGVFCADDLRESRQRNSRTTCSVPQASAAKEVFEILWLLIALMVFSVM